MPESSNELRLVGALIANPERWPEVTGTVSCLDFADSRARTIFEAIAQTAANGDPIEVATVGAELNRTHDLGSVGGSGFLLQISLDNLHCLPAPIARAVADDAERRRLQADLAQAADLAKHESPAAARVRIVQLLSREGSAGPRVLHVAEAARAHLARLRAEDGAGIALGFPPLDRVLGGLRPGEVVYVAGRPFVGKSLLVSFLALSLARRGLPVSFFSLEMEPADLGEVALGQAAGIFLRDLRRTARGPMGEEAAAAIDSALEPLPYLIHDRPGLTVDALAGEVIADRYRRGLRVVVVDNLSLLSDDTVPTRAGKLAEVESITKKLKQLARRAGVVLIVVSHLNREAAKSGEEPKIHELRHSGSIEQDADVVVLLHRTDNVNVYAPNEARPITAIVPKRRNGEPGRAELALDPRSLRFFQNPSATVGG